MQVNFMKILYAFLLISFTRNFRMSDLVEARKEMDKAVKLMR